MSGSGNPNLDKIRQELDSRKLKKQFTMVQEDDEDDLNEEEEEGGLVENGEVTTNEGNAVEIQKPQLVSEVEMVDKDQALQKAGGSSKLLYNFIYIDREEYSNRCKF